MELFFKRWLSKEFSTLETHLCFRNKLFFVSLFLNYSNLWILYKYWLKLISICSFDRYYQHYGNIWLWVVSENTVIFSTIVCWRKHQKAVDYIYIYTRKKELTMLYLVTGPLASLSRECSRQTVELKLIS